jgi:hypothetical protein
MTCLLSSAEPRDGAWLRIHRRLTARSLMITRALCRMPHLRWSLAGISASAFVLLLCSALPLMDDRAAQRCLVSCRHTQTRARTHARSLAR